MSLALSSLELMADKILLLKRVKGGYWCHVAGGVEAGETGWQTILRELKEETQIDDVELHKADFRTVLRSEGEPNLGHPMLCVILSAKPTCGA